MVTTRRRPRVRRPKPWTFPKARTLELDNGILVLLHHLPGQYVVSAGLLLDVPLTAEPTDLEGVATLTAAALTEGTAAHPGTSFVEAMESCGGVIDATTGYSHCHVLVDVPGAQLPTAVRLLAEAVIEPALADADVERHRTILAAQVEHQLATGAGRANHALRRALVSPSSRASRMKSGEPDTLAHVTGAAVRSHRADFFGPRGSVLVLSGDFEEDDLSGAVEVLGSWRNPGQLSAAHEVPAARGPAAYLVDRPGSVQADIRVGWFTIDRTDPRWPELEIAGNALGGAYLSRLNRVLREEKGFTYGASLVSAPLRDGGYTYAQGSFRNEVVGQALELMPELLDTGTSPITIEEVTRARDYLTGTSPMRYATATGVTTGVLSLLAAGLTSDFVDAQLDAYRRVTPESASQAAKELVDPAAASLVVVGDAGALETQIRAAGWDPVVVAVGEWI